MVVSLLPGVGAVLVVLILVLVLTRLVARLCGNAVAFAEGLCRLDGGRSTSPGSPRVPGWCCLRKHQPRCNTAQVALTTWLRLGLALHVSIVA